MRNCILVLFITIYCALGAAQAQDREEAGIRAESVNDSIFVLLADEAGNIGVLTGNDGTLIVDDHYAPLTEEVVAAITDRTDEPVRFVINTHWHVDHTDGNENFGRKGAIIVSHKNSRTRMESEQFLELFNVRQAAYAEEGLPKITFKKSLQFHINGETIDVFYPGSAHTDGDAVVYFRSSDVMHTGDLFVRYGLPFIDQPNGGSINGLIRAVDRIASITNDNTILIPGHGPLSSRQDLLEYREMLVTVRDHVDGLMRENLTFEEILATNPAAAYRDETVSAEAFVRLVYDSLLEESR